MVRTIKITGMVIVFLLSTVVLGITAGAAGGFSIAPNLPDNQRPETNGFFNLDVTAGQQQEITMRVENENDFDIAIEVSLFTAGTNMNGIIDYTRPGELDTTLAHDFTDIATLGVESRIIIPAGQVSVVPVTLNTPATGLGGGMVLGAIHMLRDVTDQEMEEAGMFVNQFAHVMIVRLQEGDVAIAPDFLLGDVRAETVYYRAAVVAEVRNPQPRMSMGAVASAQIYQAGQDTPIFSMADVNVDFAPNSVFPFTMMDMEGFGIHPGEYLARIQLEHEGRAWEFEREFIVAPQEAAVVNAAAANQWTQVPPIVSAGTSQQLPVWAIVAITVAVLAILVLIALLIRSKKASNREVEQLMDKIQYQGKNA